MYIMKRSGIQEIFNSTKIVKAIEGANAEVPLKDRLTEKEIKVIADDIFNIASERKVILNVEDIQDIDISILKIETINYLIKKCFLSLIVKMKKLIRKIVIKIQESTLYREIT